MRKSGSAQIQPGDKNAQSREGNTMAEWSRCSRTWSGPVAGRWELGLPINPVKTLCSKASQTERNRTGRIMERTLPQSPGRGYARVRPPGSVSASPSLSGLILCVKEALREAIQDTALNPNAPNEYRKMKGSSR